MPVLLLARGDQPSKTLLRRAIEARYGLGPPAIETLKLELKGRARAKLGPIATWIPLEGIAYFKFPFSVRWNYRTRPAGITFSESEDAFDGTLWRTRRNHHQVMVIDETEQIASVRARLWLICAIMLTPLAGHFVELRARDEHTLDAIHSEAGLTAHLHFNEDHSLDFTTTDCVNPTSGKMESYTVRLTDGQAVVDGLMLPRKLGTYWDDQPEMELSAVTAENNPAVEDSLFRLESD